ncbi:MAG: hypothetical protein ACYDAG_15315 [Chloroflexota bacterium]
MLRLAEHAALPGIGFGALTIGGGGPVLIGIQKLDARNRVEAAHIAEQKGLAVATARRQSGGGFAVIPCAVMHPPR